MVSLLNEKEKNIMDSALKLFVEKGFHGTTTAEIAKTAGVATGTLFHYFKTKEQLINQLYLYTKESMFSESKVHFRADKPLKDNLKDLWFRFINFSINEPYKIQFIFTFHTSPFITSLTKEQLETQTDELLGVYKKGVQQKELKNVSFEIIIEIFWGNIISTVNFLNKYPEKKDNVNLENIFELFWSGISI